MKYFIGDVSDLSSAESRVWVENIKEVATLYWGGEVKDVHTRLNHKVSTLTFSELNDRERFPLFGYIAGSVLNTKSGFTHCWSLPRKIEIGPYTEKYCVEFPHNNRVISLWEEISSEFPNIQVVEVEPFELFIPYTEGA